MIGSLLYRQTRMQYSCKSFGGSFVFSDMVRTAAPWLSFGKLRASWGEVPQAINPYQLELSLWCWSRSVQRKFRNDYAEPDHQSKYRGAIRTTAEIGLELRFLKNRLGITATYYQANTTIHPVMFRSMVQAGLLPHWLTQVRSHKKV
jgi:hypothetical protein